MWVPRGQVIRVVDGDTVHVLLDIGFRIFRNTKIRLAGINAPELNTPEGPRVKKRLEELLPHNSNFIFDSLGDDKYGRDLGHILINGKSVSNILLEEGLVKKYE